MIRFDAGSGGFGYVVMRPGEMFIRRIGSVVPDGSKWVFRPDKGEHFPVEVLREICERMESMLPPCDEQLEQQRYWQAMVQT